MTLTDEYVLAAYAEGFDLDADAPLLRAAFGKFAESGSWPSNQVLLVDQRQSPDPTAPGDLPQWDLGLNLGLEHLPHSPGWFAAVESLVGQLQQLHVACGREFVLFLCFRSRPELQQHLAFIGPSPVDLPWLRSAIERLTKRRT